MGSRLSKASSKPQYAKVRSSKTSLLTKETESPKEKDCQARPPTPMPSASPPAAAPPAYEAQSKDQVVDPAAQDAKPKASPPTWFDKFVYCSGGTVTIVCADGKTIKAPGGALAESSSKFLRLLTHTHKDDPIDEVKLTDRCHETYPIVWLYVALLLGKDLPLPKGNMPYALWQLGNLLRAHEAHREKVILGLIISNWLSKPEIRELVDFPFIMFLVGDILDQPRVCADVLRAYAHRTVQQVQNKGESLWNPAFWSVQNTQCCSEKVSKALQEAYTECGKTLEGRLDADKLVKSFEKRVA
ncbi:hypothetical protein IAU59_002757 [Kwoniella sp. CBS 9459]